MNKTDSFNLSKEKNLYIKDSKVSLNLNSVFNYNPAISIYQIRTNNLKNNLLITNKDSCNYCKYNAQLLNNRCLQMIEKIFNEIKTQYFQTLNLIILLDKLMLIIKILESYL